MMFLRGRYIARVSLPARTQKIKTVSCIQWPDCSLIVKAAFRLTI